VGPWAWPSESARKALEGPEPSNPIPLLPPRLRRRRTVISSHLRRHGMLLLLLISSSPLSAARILPYTPLHRAVPATPLAESHPRRSLLLVPAADRRRRTRPARLTVSPLP
jgi:hypothetical protein